MDKRYQIFVSSTFEDLQEERKEVMQALLEMDCIPAGMELFPASDEDQWTLIKKVIDDSDYYILILAGRYGSIGIDGIGYTEMEYRYAMETGKPIISFLHKYPENISAKKSESSEEGRKKLKAFKELVQKKMTKYWTNADDLGSVVSRSMIKLTKSTPAIGWVRADNVTDESSMKEILKLKKENEELRTQIEVNKTHSPHGAENLSQGDDFVEGTFLVYWNDEEDNSYSDEIKFKTTWNSIFTFISPHLIEKLNEDDYKKLISLHIKEQMKKELIKISKYSEFSEFKKFTLADQDFQKMKVQFKALGLVRQIVQNIHSEIKNGSYWTLTEYGDYVMTQLVALKR